MKRTLLTSLAVPLALVGCSAVPIEDVERDELDVTVDYRHYARRVELDTTFKAGFWDRKVDPAGQRPEVVTDGGEVIALNRSADAHRYRLELEPETGPYRLILPGWGELTLPIGEPVRLRHTDGIEGRLFDRDDELAVSVRGETDRPRGWSFTAWCGDEAWTVERSLDEGDTEIELNLDRLMRQINNAAEADLNGQIPVALTLWESYDIDWQPPFQPGSARALDELNFQVDTAGFRFQARVRVQVSNNAFFSFQNQAWPVRYCY